MASATIQPISDHPKNRLMTITEPVFGTCRVIATIVGTKYRSAATMKSPPKTVANIDDLPIDNQPHVQNSRKSYKGNPTTSDKNTKTPKNLETE